MAERTVKVNLIAQVSAYISGMEQAARKTRELGSEAEKLAAKRQAFEDLGRPLLAFGAIAAAAVGIAIKKFADFDQAMSNVSAVTQETTGNMALLRDAALAAGGETVFTATEAANAIEELGKAGLTTTDILEGALNGALALAASGQLEVARAAEISATTLKQFGLEGNQAGRVADVLSAGAGKALGSVEDLAQGMKFVGPIAASMGVSLEETTGALALFADQGILGEQAGTSLRGVLASLTSPSKEAAKEIERLGINLYDAKGGFLGVENVAGELGDAFKGLDDQQRDFSLGLIFGNAQVTAARVLFKGGAEDIAKYTAEVNDSGYAARVAADRLDNLKGDVEKLGGAFDTFLIKSGSGANDILRQLTQTLTFLVDGAASVPEPVLGVGLALGTVTAAVALAGGGFLLLVPRVAAAKLAMKEFGITAGTAGKAVAIAGGAISIAAGAFALFSTKAAEARTMTDAIKDTLDPATGSVTKYTRAWIDKTLAESTWVQSSAKDVGVTQKEITDAILQGGDALDKLKAKFTGQNNIVDAFNGSAVAAGNASGTIRELETALDGAGNEFKNTPKVALTAAEAYQEAADTASNLQSNLASLIETINKANGVGQDAVTTNATYQQTLADTAEYIRKAQEGVEGFTLGFDRNTVAGSANQAMIAEQAAKLLSAAEAQLLLDGNVDTYLATVSGGQQTLLDQATALGATDEQLRFIKDSVLNIPDRKEIEVLVEATDAQRKLDALRTTMDALRIPGTGLSPYIRKPEVVTKAEGGYIAGAGTGTSDSIPARLSNGEFVINAAATSQNRSLLELINKGGSVRRFADGGPVWSTQSHSSGGSSSSTKVDINVTGVEKEAGAELIYQRLAAGLALG